MYNHEHGPIGVKSGPIEAHWDHTFYGTAALFEDGDELLNQIFQDTGPVNATTGIQVPMNQWCMLTQYAIAVRGDDGIGFSGLLLFNVTRNGSTVETIGIDPTWDGQVYTACGRIANDLFAPCDLLEVVPVTVPPDSPVSDLHVRINLGFQLR